jgi:hypothetical protein
LLVWDLDAIFFISDLPGFADDPKTRAKPADTLIERSIAVTLLRLHDSARRNAPTPPRSTSTYKRYVAGSSAALPTFSTLTTGIGTEEVCRLLK